MTHCASLAYVQALVLEVGCGVGNSTYPLLESNPALRFTSFDFAATAVEILKQHPQYDSNKIDAFCWDPAVDEIPERLQPGMGEREREIEY